jgi:hypothetical protein
VARRIRPGSPKPITMVVIRCWRPDGRPCPQARPTEGVQPGRGRLRTSSAVRASSDSRRSRGPSRWHTIGTFSYSPTVVALHALGAVRHHQGLLVCRPVREYAQPFCVPKDSPKSVKELLDYARQNQHHHLQHCRRRERPHIFLEALARRRMSSSPRAFRGGAEGVSAPLGGHVKAGLAKLATPAKAGECRPLAVLSESGWPPSWAC